MVYVTFKHRIDSKKLYDTVNYQGIQFARVIDMGDTCYLIGPNSKSAETIRGCMEFLPFELVVERE